MKLKYEIWYYNLVDLRKFYYITLRKFYYVSQELPPLKKERGVITEKDLREQIRDLCKVLGYKFYFSWTSIHSPRGMPDLILVKPPRILFVELKTDKGQVSEYQKEWLDILNECPGCEVYVVRPSDIEEFAKVLQSKDDKIIALMRLRIK